MIIHVTLPQSFLIKKIVLKNRSSYQMVSYPFQPLGEFRVYSLKFFQQKSRQSEISMNSRNKSST